MVFWNEPDMGDRALAWLWFNIALTVSLYIRSLSVKRYVPCVTYTS